MTVSGSLLPDTAVETASDTEPLTAFAALIAFQQMRHESSSVGLRHYGDQPVLRAAEHGRGLYDAGPLVADRHRHSHLLCKLHIRHRPQGMRPTEKCAVWKISDGFQ